MDEPFDASLDSFLAEREAVSGLARRLARGDVHAAEDLEQEVWAALLARPPREASSARGWLRAVTRTRAVERLRRRGRAGRAEREAARPEAVEGVDETCARRDLGEHLALALRELGEPYRSVLALRFVEDLPPREVARRLGRPVETVRTQTRRGLAALRAKLEAPQQRRPSWALLVLALRRPRVALPVALTAAAGAIVLALLSSPGVGGRLSAAPAEVVAARTSAPVELARAEPAGAAPPAAFAPALPAPERWIDLALRDGADAPLVGAEVAVVTHAGERPAGRSDAHGRLRVPLALEDLASANDGWPLARDAAELAVHAPGRAARNVFVFLPEHGGVGVEAALPRLGRRLTGRVVDAAGRPLAGARVHAGPTQGMGARERLDRDGRALAVVRGREASADAHGAFELAGLPPEPLTLTARAAGHALGALAVATDEAEVEIALAPAEPLCGVARLAGRPAAGARIAWHADDGVRWPTAWRSARADEQGRFEVPRPAAGTLALEARADGALAATALDLDAGPAWWTAELARAYPLSVRLLEPDGRPAVGLYLCLREAGGGPLLGAAECDGEGRARFEPSRPGPYDLTVLPPRGAGGWPRELLRELFAGGGERLLRLGPAPVHASALEVRFDAVAGARLELRHLASDVAEHADAAADGRLAWRNLPAGRWAASAQFADGSARDLGEFTLEPGRTLDLGAIE